MKYASKAVLANAVFKMDCRDLHRGKTSPAEYMSAAEVAYTLVRRDFGQLPMRAFVGRVESLTCTAENIFFENHGYFADLDGSGNAAVAVLDCAQLLSRLRLSVH